MMVSRTEPRFDVQIYNDPAIAVDIPVPDVWTMQYDGYLVGALYKGAGVEGCELQFSDGQESQSISGTDIVIDGDTLQGLTGPSPGKEFAGFTTINAPLKKGTKITIIPRGTGTAEANLWLLFSRAGTGPYILNVSILFDHGSATEGDTILDLPTFMARLKRIFVRGQGGNDLTFALGPGGKPLTIPVRAIPINTDVEPIAFHSIDSPTPDKLIFKAMNGFTGTSAWTYVQLE